MLFLVLTLPFSWNPAKTTLRGAYLGSVVGEPYTRPPGTSRPSLNLPPPSLHHAPGRHQTTPEPAKNLIPGLRQTTPKPCLNASAQIRLGGGLGELWSQVRARFGGFGVWCRPMCEVQGRFRRFWGGLVQARWKVQGMFRVVWCRVLGLQARCKVQGDFRASNDP